MSIEYYWEDFTVGRTIDLGSREVSRAEVLEFANRYDPQSFHVDEAAAEASIYGGLIASGWHTAAMVMRLMCDGYLLRSASLGSPGIDNLRWLKPVRPGDTLRARMTVLESRPSSSKPDRGTVKSSWEVFNQRGELVMSMEGFGMFRRRQSVA
jgi:acyl dehydratase